ncbi:hypothetical protein [Chromobacterium phragmitis]|uniref:Cold-shock protein n=1 Tax=Chromobacterium phragmitis TaxID=2202141 RepID=A0ABV0IU81_9NEIS
MSWGMGGTPWEHGTLVSVGNAPFNQLAIQRRDGAMLVVQPSREAGALDKKALDKFAVCTGDNVRFRVLRNARSKLSGEMVVLSQMELER